MLSMTELKEIVSMEGKEGYFVSLYLNVDPLLNKKGDYIVHLKNMVKNAVDRVDKDVHKKVKDDIERIENYALANKRLFKKGLVLLSSKANLFWKEYNFGVPINNELIIDKTPYTKPLLDILDTYQRYVVLLVDKESARIFVVFLGEIVEYGEVHTPDIPGKHKKGGWYALSEKQYERHIDHHISLHLKDVAERLDSFLGGEYVGRLIIGGSDEAVSMVRGMLHKTTLDRIIGTVRVEMFAKPDEVLKRVEPIVYDYEKKKERETIETLIVKTMKNDNAILGLDNVLNALQEQKVMKLVFIKDYKANGYLCTSCDFLTTQKVNPCPYCKGNMETVDCMVDLASEKAARQGALIEVAAEDKRLFDAGGIGAFLRF
ncbi:hypothetical protein M1N69_01875 [Thermodesulfovibrionales bacterium]|nr:hypothetical protein [Thermodesulfovibrionales bacterium]